MSSVKCKLKQGDVTMPISEWLNSRTLTPPNAGKDVEQQELSFIAGGKSKQYSHFGKQLALLYQTKHSPAI